MTNNKFFDIFKFRFLLVIRNLELGIRRGFTLVEVMVVIGIMLILLSLTTPNLFNLANETSLESTMQTLTADIRLAQAKAMTGDTEGRTSADTYGVYFDQAQPRYVLFHGASYSPSDVDNFAIDLPPQMQFVSVQFASSQVVFSKIAGEVSGFIAGQNTVTLRNNETGQESTFTMNKYGVITGVN